MVLNAAFALIIGYVLGSILPAYVIGAARGIDIRTVGTGNAGTLNAYHELGPGPAVVTATWDGTKGLIAMFIAYELGVGEPLIYATGLAAFLGHQHPFYLGFKGARGLSVNVGLAYFCVGLSLVRGWLPWPWFVALVVAYAALYAWVHVGAIAQLILLPILYAVVALRSGDLAFNVFFGLVVAFIWELHASDMRHRGVDVGALFKARLRRA